MAPPENARHMETAGEQSWQYDAANAGGGPPVQEERAEAAAQEDVSMELHHAERQHRGGGDSAENYFNDIGGDHECLKQ